MRSSRSTPVNDSQRNAQTPMEAFFPDGRVNEYYLQRLRLVASQQTPVQRVHDIRDVPDTPGEFPCIEVVIRIAGLKIHNPVTETQMFSTNWIRNHFEGQPCQQAFLDSFSQFLGNSIPNDHPEANLKRKFEHYRDGAPGNLPARADLYVRRDELMRHLVAARKWLRGLKRAKQEFTKKDRIDFLKEISLPIFWWAKYVQEGCITLEQIARHSPQTTAMEILALRFDKTLEAIKSRFRKEV